MVAIEKKPNVTAETNETNNARKFLNFNWRNTEITDRRATNNNIHANTKCCILLYPPYVSCLCLI